jgi:LysM repeat protein
MNNPNPFVPKGSLLEQQSLRRSRLKIAVGCALAVSVTGLVVMLIQGCKREQPAQDNSSTPPPDTSVAAAASSNAPDLSSNSMAAAPSNTVAAPAPMAQPTPTPTPTPALTPTPVEPAPAAGSEYVVVQGDTLAKIAKAQGVSLKALVAANPGVDPKKLKIKQKLVLPGKTTDAAAVTPTGTPAAAAETAGASYTVKSGDTLSKIAKRNGVSLRALRAANNLTTDHIKVGQKLAIPSKAEAAAPAAATPDTSAAPVAPAAPPSAPVTPTPSPAPGH